MNQLIRYYNQNRKKIWGIVIIIASAILLLQLVNYFYKIQLEEKSKVGNNLQQQENTISANNTSVADNKSVITGEEISKDNLKTATNIIGEFVSYCNEGEIEKAYNLLTEECKEQLYSSIEDFEKAYYGDVFKGEKKEASIENWYHNIYKVKFLGDMLATGKKEEKEKQDYITIVEKDNEYKLNINSYIGQEEIDKTTQKDNIKVEVLYKNMYIDYEEYTMKVTNDTENIVLLDGRTDTKSLYIEDSKKVKHSSYSHELTKPMLTVNSGDTRELTIKFYSSFVSTKKIEAIVFSNLILLNGQRSEGIEFRANV